ncbi:hypothetical protein Aple_073150 [Acrocarpospora pleiomorpha]|uniref:DUF3893 domain-containing protein n=1 Tax=Acrocarpospora pleiomorpha TaxID=90975 RepID=A0A5M3XU55_9ACTN|nr:DUF3962 domain-containing protein [Acrocarpospora pleiomorpha]GES24416.1 hypothetical protein Aple_073150 [Acrocarpospora pleiomorpha]
MPHSLIRSSAYEPDPAHSPWVETHQMLRFGDTWQNELLRLYRRRWPAAPSLPVRGLNRLAQAIVPGLIATGRRGGPVATSDMPWFYARHQIPTDVAMALFLAWVPTLAPEQGAEDELERVLNAVEANPLVWSTEPVDLLESHLSPGGTVEPERRLYALLTEWLAARLAKRPYRTTGGELRFRVVSQSQGTELVSWPPQRYMSQGRTWYYSAVVTITVQTVPFAGSFRVHASSHIRRWATTDGVRPRRRRGATVLFDVPVPWPDLVTQRSRLVPNAMGYSSILKRLAWRNEGPAGLLKSLDLVRSYPEPAELAAHPERYLLGHEGLAAGIVFSYGMGPHQVATGLMPGERAELDAWVEEGLAPYFRRVPDLVRVHRSSKPALLPELRSGDLRQNPQKYAQNLRERIHARRAALRATFRGAPLEIEIFWQQEKTRDHLVGEIRESLGLPSDETTPGDHDRSWRIGGLDVRLRSRELRELGAPLELREGNRREALRQAVLTRREEIFARLGITGQNKLPTVPRLAFVEIGKRELFPSADADPKHALRFGFAHAGRLTQFIQDADHAEAPLEIRAKSAVLDAFRQLGADTLPLHRGIADVPEDLQYVGLWMVRRNVTGPTKQAARRLIAVRLRPGAAEWPVCGWDENKCEWITYPQLLLTLARETEPDEIGWEPPSEDEMFVDEQLAGAIRRRVRTLLYEVRDQPTLLMVNSGNLRKAWPSLANGRLVKDTLQFGRDRRQRIAAYGPDLRLVLIRDRNSREETAQWFAIGQGEPGFASGLWGPENAEPDNRVFTSTTDVPPIVRSLRRGMRKLIPDPQWPDAVGKKAWNPQALELAVVGCRSPEVLREAGLDNVTPDDPATWAAIVHQSRFHDDHQPLSHPLAQHLAALAEEYVLSSWEASD